MAWITVADWGGWSAADELSRIHSVNAAIASVCGLPKTSHQLDGRDISPLLAEPTADWKHPAITTYCENVFSLRSGQWRYIRYRDGSEELYDHSKDPHEFNNIASQPELESTKTKFRSFIPKTFRKSLGGRNG